MTGVPGKPKEVHVTVTLNSERPDDFTIEPAPVGSLPRGTNGALVFENRGHSGFWIYFDLIDMTGQGYKFIERDNAQKKVVKDGVWSAMGAENCPMDGEQDVLTARAVLNDGMTLKVRNPNVDKDEIGLFKYTLRVSKDGGDSYLPLDPVGENRNGPISDSTFTYFASLSAGVILGIAATLGAQALLEG